MFLEEREEKNLEFQNSLHKKVCRVKSDTFVDAYGFCLAALIQNPEINNNIVVVKNEKTYIQLARDMILN